MSLNGANRLGSNSLTECLVFGARAGRTAAAYADRAGPVGASVAAQASDEERRLNTNFIDATGGTERISAVRAEMHVAMEEAAGIFRTGTKLDAAADTVSRLQQHARRLKLDDRSRTFNTELPSALELGYMLDVAEVVLRSAAQRTESRGAHQRTDYPARNDEQFLVHSLAHRTRDGLARIEYLPVTITKWPPGERVYGR